VVTVTGDGYQKARPTPESCRMVQHGGRVTETVGGVVNVAFLSTGTDTKSVRVEVIRLRLALGVGVEVL